jgi:hypothetical protein
MIERGAQMHRVDHGVTTVRGKRDIACLAQPVVGGVAHESTQMIRDADRLLA